MPERIETDQQRLNRLKNEKRSLNGYSNEAFVLHDLMRKGYQVFLPFSSMYECDLVAFKKGDLPKRIEVKSGRLGNSGKIYSIPCNRENKYDVLAIVCNYKINYSEPL